MRYSDDGRKGESPRYDYSPKKQHKSEMESRHMQLKLLRSFIFLLSGFIFLYVRISSS